MAMIKSLLRRLLYAICILCVISLLAFWLSRLVPGDEVRDYLSIDERGYSNALNPLDDRRAYIKVAKKRGFDLPPFYFSVTSYSGSIDLILPLEERSSVKMWIRQTHDDKKAIELYQFMNTQLQLHCGTHLSTYNVDLCSFYHRLLSTPDINRIHAQALTYKDTLSFNRNFSIAQQEGLGQLLEKSKNQFSRDEASASFIRQPQFRWHGVHNQYHRWLTGLISQKPLTSLVDGRNAWTKIYDALKWTLMLNGFAFLIAMIAGIAIGIWSGRSDHKKAENYIQWLLFALFAIPSFWLGTLFIYFFSSGEWLTLFPAGGLGEYHNASNFIERWLILSYHLFLPVLCLALGSLAYVSRQMKQSVLHELQQPYVRALRIQGISEKTILRKHVIRNAMFPVITIIGGSIPALLSGSLIIEVIFSIPGMGRLMFTSLMSRDWPVAFPILMLGAAVTVLSYIMTDIVYKWADPRVKTMSS